MSFIAQDFNNLNIITVLEGRTQAVIRDHFLKPKSFIPLSTRCNLQNP
ncbi:transposase [Streptococcus pneumoniae]|uniref:Transposase n=1 Tax=Streptococcus pneumoniae TaxID=1313 RepID=A0A4J1QC71_STREE|nr:transposase [Streptococcus pneumoniae]CWD48411.1 transposase [Streptococcus pneumoniae]CZD39137.1 transposase [Streptococcus pneumoniae]CZD51403.1 transposase [Streptococcus pneumoniae]VIW65766.1 transposase [Streptococcus pneumoniae]